jgi:hypothetical protein
MKRKGNRSRDDGMSNTNMYYNAISTKSGPSNSNPSIFHSISYPVRVSSSQTNTVVDISLVGPIHVDMFFIDTIH